MPYELRPVTIADTAGVVQTNMTAFYESAIWRLLWPNMTLQEAIESNLKRFPHSLVQGRDRQRHQMVIETSTGEVVGYASWILPKDGSITWLEAQVTEASDEDKKSFEEMNDSACENGRPIGRSQERVDALNGRLLAAKDAAVRGVRTFLELSYICTHPSHQRQGVGELLIRSGIAQADAAGLPAFVMGTPAGLRLYEKNGFKRIGTVEQDVTKFGGVGSHVSYFLVRQPMEKV